ncbi:MAG: redoxin family protein, partial [Roseibium sp.]|uniref:redoxin domain-containing protein n=1 Tax=Roseibium sp. TaxID=1936156 RepID=UPI002638E696
MTSPKLQAGMPFPVIDTALLGGGTTILSRQSEGFDWKLIVVYRGRHCPLCTRYLIELNEVLSDLNALGVDVIAVSADTEERVSAQMADVDPKYKVGFGLTVDQMKELGLYISGKGNGIDVAGPFAEPGLFVVNERGDLQIIDISNVPFARPDPASIVQGIRFFRSRTA